jgi:hypothetical protein
MAPAARACAPALASSVPIMFTARARTTTSLRARQLAYTAKPGQVRMPTRVARLIGDAMTAAAG